MCVGLGHFFGSGLFCEVPFLSLPFFSLFRFHRNTTLVVPCSGETTPFYPSSSRHRLAHPVSSSSSSSSFSLSLSIVVIFFSELIFISFIFFFYRILNSTEEETKRNPRICPVLKFVVVIFLCRNV